MRWLSSSRLRSRSTGWTTWRTSSTVVLRGVTWTWAGRSRMPSARRRISFEKVALKSRFWRRGGSSARIFRMSRMKPMSSIRSASSRTRISTRDRSIVRWPTWSSSRPGVATTISGPARSARTWASKPTPAVDDRRADGPARAVGPDALLDLDRELAGRGQDEAADRRSGRAAAVARIGCRRGTARTRTRSGAGGSAGRRRPSCRSRSGRRRARRGPRGRAGSPRPGRRSARCSPGRRPRGEARASARVVRRTR